MKNSKHQELKEYFKKLCSSKVFIISISAIIITKVGIGGYAVGQWLFGIVHH